MAKQAKLLLLLLFQLIEQNVMVAYSGLDPPGSRGGGRCPSGLVVRPRGRYLFVGRLLQLLLGVGRCPRPRRHGRPRLGGRRASRLHTRGRVGSSLRRRS